MTEALKKGETTARPVASVVAAERTTLFISKGTPEDDDFVLWLAPRLEALGYKIFADILTLETGDRWRQRSPRRCR